MIDLGFVLLLMAWSAGVGLRIIARFAPAPEHPTDALALSVPLGLGTLALAALVLGELGMLTSTAIGVVLIVGGVIGGKAAYEIIKRSFHTLITQSRPQGFLDWAFDLSLLATLIGTLLTSLIPVTDGDALCYHLQVPKLFLARQGMFFDPDLHETAYPLVTEMLYAVALALRGPVACRLVQWGLGLAFGAGVTALARPVLGRRARWGGTIALLVPAVSNGMGAPLNDVALASFGVATLLAWVRWADRPTLGAAALAGVLGGLALGVKYPALVWVGLLGMSMVIPLCFNNNIKSGSCNFKLILMRTIPAVLTFAAAAVLVGGCWYLRTYSYTGNPVYPFFRHTFGGSGIDEVLDPIKRPLPLSTFNLVTALGPLTLQPDRFDSFSHQFGPAFLLFLPAALFLRPPRRVLGLSALGFAFLTICLTRRQSMRFVLIAVGPMAVAVAWLALTCWERRGAAGRALIALMVVMLGFEASLSLARGRHGLSVVLGRESAEAYLMRREPTYRVGQWVDKHLPGSARLMGQDHRGFYIPRPYTMELAHRRRTGLGTFGESPQQIVDHLRREGYTHLMLCPPVPETAVEFDPTLSIHLAPWLKTRRPLFSEPITDGDGVLRHYAIYDLQSEGDLAETERARR
ncbi:MAG: 4-amino-4-deoxy-L-arabinose transferase [Isosphaeraceae bacterium]